MSDRRAKIREVLLDLREKIEAEAVSPRYSSAAWIFTPLLRLDRFVALLDGMIESEVGAARLEALETALEVASLSCACRCRAHGRSGCPVCLGVERCPLHSEPDPSGLERSAG